MKKLLTYAIPAILVGLAIAGAVNAQVFSPNYFVKIANYLYPINNASTTIGTSTATGQFQKLTDANGNKYSTSTASGGGVSTSSPNTFTANQQFSGGITDASSTHIVPTFTYSVCPNTGECDYSNLQSALNAASGTTSTAKIYVRPGIYVAPAGGFKVCASNLSLIGTVQSSTVLQYNGTTDSAGISSCNSSTALTGLEIGNLKITNTGVASTSKGIDFSGIELSYIHDLKISNAFATLYATGTIADYNTIMNIVSTPQGSSGNPSYHIVLGGRANFNALMNIRGIDAVSTTAYDVFGRNDTCINCDSETGADLFMHIESGSFGFTAIQPYSESDIRGWQFDNASKATTIVGGYTHDTINIVNNGGTFSFLNNYLNNAPFTYSLEVSSTPPNAWLTPFQFSIPTSNVTATIGTIIGLEFNNPTDGFTQGMEWVNNTNQVASYTLGIYGPLISPDTFLNAPLLVSTSGTSNTAAATPVNVKWPTLTFMPGGLYFGVLEMASTSQSYLRQANQAISPGWCGSNANGGTYSLLPGTGPAFTPTGSNCPFLTIQMAVASGTY